MGYEFCARGCKTCLHPRFTPRGGDALTFLLAPSGNSTASKNKRLTENIKDDLKAITLEYQKKIHLLALQHKIWTEILFEWIGIWTKVRGPDRFNNYCRYSPEARRLFSSKSVPPGKRMQQVGEEWRNLDDDEQLKYNNLDFINSLRQRMGFKPVENPKED
ncbi:hypothetical protein PSHT_05813 [Puccinia striiformis]|uniref:Uncharacterized protein n=1 Tax=Puccinia striiformis TaxID=27350 RepID=A0A2S4W9M9_9BASI|nr:hypothetical protein PSHT_05813 [Puccinia striiformis]